MSVFRIVSHALAMAVSHLQALVVTDVWSNWFVSDKVPAPVLVLPRQNRLQTRSER